MVSKEEVNSILLEAFNSGQFVVLWWGLRLPGLGDAKPRDVWEEDPQRVLDYVKGY